MRTCRDIVGLVTEYVEGGLTGTESRRLEDHLTACGACREFVDTLKRTRDAVRSLRIESIPDECRRRLHRFLEKKPRRSP